MCSRNLLEAHLQLREPSGPAILAVASPDRDDVQEIIGNGSFEGAPFAGTRDESRINHGRLFSHATSERCVSLAWSE